MKIVNAGLKGTEKMEVRKELTAAIAVWDLGNPFLFYLPAVESTVLFIGLSQGIFI